MSEEATHHMPRQTWLNLSEEKRERVYRAAQAEFALRGFQAGSLNVIANEAGVAKGSLFQYFDDKMDLWTTVCEMGTAEIDAHLLPAMNALAGLPAFELLHAFMDEFMTYYFEHEQARAAVGAVILESDREARQVAQAVVHESYREALEPLVQAACDAGQIRDDLSPELLLAEIERLFRLVEWAPSLPESDPVYDLAKHEPDQLRAFAHQELDLIERAWSPS